MSEKKIREVFSKNLKHYLELNDKQPVDIVRDLNIPFSTVSNWINGLKMPRMGNVEMLARYLHVEKSDLLEDKNADEEYYINQQARELAEFMHKNPDYAVLFDAARKVRPEDLAFVKEFIDKMTK